MRLILKRLLVITLAVFILTGLFTGCVSKGGSSDNHTIRAAVGPEPETIDPALNTSVDGGIYLVHMFEGLTKVDKNGDIVGGAASEWKISSDGLKYTFIIREDARWSDGQPVKAQDFEYAWKRVLNPKTASSFAYQLYYLKNGEEYNTGNAREADVGVKAKDDRTLEVELKAATAYFIGLTGFPTYFPVRKDIVEKYGDKWAQSPDTYIGNGAYKLTEWKHDSEIVIKLNSSYWDAKAVKIPEIRWLLTDDYSTAYNSFEAGELDFNNGLIPVEELPNLVAGKKTVPVNELGVNFIVFNVTRPPLDNVKVRKALSLAIDRKFIVDKVLRGGQRTAIGLVPYGMPGYDDRKDFRTEKDGGTYCTDTPNIVEAKKLLAEAGYPDGKGLPEIEYLTNSGEVNSRLAEALQNQWAKIGVKVKISSMEWKAFLPYVIDKKHTIAVGAWGGDYMDPMAFLDVFTSENPNNDPAWSNKKYDELIKNAQSTADQKKRMAWMHEAEKILMDEMPIAPVSYRLKNTLANPRLKGIYQSPLGFVYFHNAYWN